MKACIHPEGDIHTPYGATEALPVASIAAAKCWAKRPPRRGQGAGVCVGRKFPGIQWKVIRIVDGPIPIDRRGRGTARGRDRRIDRPRAGRHAAIRHARRSERPGKIADGDGVWHRMGDVGLPGRARAVLVLRPRGPSRADRRRADVHDPLRGDLQPAPGGSPQCPGRRRPAGQQRPVIVVEPKPGQMPRGRRRSRAFPGRGPPAWPASPLTAAIEDFLFHPAFPVDIRHNAKIFREKLAVWAAGN